MLGKGKDREDFILVIDGYLGLIDLSTFILLLGNIFAVIF